MPQFTAEVPTTIATLHVSLHIFPLKKLSSHPFIIIPSDPVRITVLPWIPSLRNITLSLSFTLSWASNTLEQYAKILHLLLAYLTTFGDTESTQFEIKSTRTSIPSRPM